MFSSMPQHVQCISKNDESAISQQRVGLKIWFMSLIYEKHGGCSYALEEYFRSCFLSSIKVDLGPI